jgi:predicted alpha/beta superfamily hydrolase
LGENRKIWVYVPDGAVNNTERFPVVYVLDGDGHFSSVVGVTQQLSTINGQYNVSQNDYSGHTQH